MNTVLVGDIGGTKTRLYLFSARQGPSAPLASETFASRHYDALEEILRAFTAGAEHRFSRAVFGVAGPVVQGRVQVTNLPWVIEEAALCRLLQIQDVRLMNDLEMVAYALPFLQPDDRMTLNAGPGRAEPHGTMAVIAPGTGLGEAFLTHGTDGFSAHPSEGGHVSFAPRNAQQVRLLQYLLTRFDHVSYERVCSGIGIPNLYRFLKASGEKTIPAALDARINEAEDPTPLIINAGLESSPPCPLCEQVVRLFVDILGAAAGNLALKVVATGGVYIGGGIPPRIGECFRTGIFMQAFKAKGRMANLLDTIPVHVILKPDAAVFGAACYALDRHRPDGAQ